MTNKKNFTISIGDFGVIIALHHGSEVISKILVSSMDEESKVKIRELLTQNPYPIYVLLDNADQNYVRKSYPPTNVISLKQVIKRQELIEYTRNKNILQNHYFYKDKVKKKWQCTFVSVNKSPEIDKWIDFLLEVPNRLMGIYMLPIEVYSLCNDLFQLIKVEKDIKVNDDTVISLVSQNKVSGIRQVAFNKKSIIFTRVINYNFEDPSFPKQFEQDIFRTNEYLKMVFPTIRSENVNFINILSDKILSKVVGLTEELGAFNYTPSQVVQKLKISNAVPKEENFSDVIIANIFVNNKKKLLKFSNSKISYLEKFYLSLKAATILNVFAAATLAMLIFNLIINLKASSTEIDKIISERNSASAELELVNNASLADSKQSSSNPAEIIDFGRVSENVTSAEDLETLFKRVNYIKKYNAKPAVFSYKLIQFDPKQKSLNKSEINISGEINEKSGDIEKIFKNFDSLTLETKKEFAGYRVKFSEISSNINFGNKYYVLPFDINIQK